MTFMSECKDILDQFKKNKDFPGLFDYAVYLAMQIIQSNKLGRRQDEILKEILTEEQLTELHRRTINNMMIPDGYYEEEKDFFNHFADSKRI